MLPYEHAYIARVLPLLCSILTYVRVGIDCELVESNNSGEFDACQRIYVYGRYIRKKRIRREYSQHAEHSCRSAQPTSLVIHAPVAT